MSGNDVAVNDGVFDASARAKGGLIAKERHGLDEAPLHAREGWVSLVFALAMSLGASSRARRVGFGRLRVQKAVLRLFTCAKGGMAGTVETYKDTAPSRARRVV